MSPAGNFESARSAGGFLSQDSLLELLDLGVLLFRHLVNHLLNRRNVRLANLYQLHARDSTAIAGPYQSPIGIQGVPHWSQQSSPASLGNPQSQ
jgi:hypothetical protein